MADRMAAEIWIGGKLRRLWLEEFPISDLRIDWDGTCFDSTTEAGILSARDENKLLHFADCEIAWGEFAELESWSREHKIPFRRHSSGKYEYLPETVEYRPDIGKGVEVYCLATDAGEPLVLKSEIAPILTAMTKLQKSTKPLEIQLRSWKRLAGKLIKVVPPDLPLLPPFEIV
ncbi:MAG: hypothetical protein GXY83_20835 [Rhodopirellula sp.]|nr:hypothetical protein [Rhodopirellula sp.]